MVVKTTLNQDHLQHLPPNQPSLVPAKDGLINFKGGSTLGVCLYMEKLLLLTNLLLKSVSLQTFIMKEETKAFGFKAYKDCVTIIMCGSVAESMMNDDLQVQIPRALNTKIRTCCWALDVQCCHAHRGRQPLPWVKIIDIFPFPWRVRNYIFTPFNLLKRSVLASNNNVLCYMYCTTVHCTV